MHKIGRNSKHSFNNDNKKLYCAKVFMADKVAIIVAEVDVEANHSYILTQESMEKEEIYPGRPGH